MTTTEDRPTRRYRTPPTTPRLRPVTKPNGRRELPDASSYWPLPSADRPRFRHHRVAEEFHGGLGVTYRTYADGLVVAYGRALHDDVPPEADGEALGRELPYRDWVAVIWTRHPLLNPRGARMARYLIDNATFEETVAAIDEWELNDTD